MGPGLWVSHSLTAASGDIYLSGLGDNWEDGTLQEWVEPRDLKFALVAVTLGQYKARLGWP